MRFLYDPKDESFMLQFTINESKHIAKDNYLKFDKSNLRELSAAFVSIGGELGARVIEIEKKFKKENEKSSKDSTGTESINKK